MVFHSNTANSSCKLQYPGMLFVLQISLSFGYDKPHKQLVSAFVENNL